MFTWRTFWHLRQSIPLPQWLQGHSRVIGPYLSCHPDQRFAAFLRRGRLLSFRIGFRREQPLRCASSNMASVNANPQVVDSYLVEELSDGKLHLGVKVPYQPHWAHSKGPPTWKVSSHCGPFSTRDSASMTELTVTSASSGMLQLSKQL